MRDRMQELWDGAVPVGVPCPQADPAAVKRRVNAALNAVVSTSFGRSIGTRSISAWNCIRNELTDAPPSTRRTEIGLSASTCMASSRSLT